MVSYLKNSDKWLKSHVIIANALLNFESKRFDEATACFSDKTTHWKYAYVVSGEPYTKWVDLSAL